MVIIEKFLYSLLYFARLRILKRSSFYSQFLEQQDQIQLERLLFQDRCSIIHLVDTTSILQEGLWIAPKDTSQK